MESAAQESLSAFRPAFPQPGYSSEPEPVCSLAELAWLLVFPPVIRLPAYSSVEPAWLSAFRQGSHSLLAQWQMTLTTFRLIITNLQKAIILADA
ncbi:MAG: hypothetical protein C4527_14310 [Candidatus Omnitrophota bacterium]|nr:MAG: hypothetical protein C4527_14310 [Candidatus Omnitrophota bacterium]